MTPQQEYVLKHSMPVTESGCWLWIGTSSKRRYGVVDLHPADGPRRRTHAHRFSYEAFRGKPGEVIRHVCDVPECVNPDHLVPGSHHDNVQDRVLRGRSTHGEQHHAAKLTAKDVLAIRAGGSTREWMERLGVSSATIQRARNGKKWRSVS